MLISDTYRQLNEQLHADRPDYGAHAARKWGFLVAQLMEQLNTGSLLDYGAGKRTLGTFLRDAAMKAGQSHLLKLQEYDPAVPEIAGEPGPADIVACLDVLEHVEPECLDTVLAHLAGKVRRLALIVVHTGPAVKTLPDGRNAHLIQEDWLFWAKRLQSHLPVRYVTINPSEVLFLAAPPEAGLVANVSAGDSAPAETGPILQGQPQTPSFLDTPWAAR